MGIDIKSGLGPLVALMEKKTHLFSPPFDDRLLESFPELKMVASRYQDSPYAALNNAQRRVETSWVVGDLIYDGVFDSQFGVAQLDVYLEYLDGFRSLAEDAGSRFLGYYQGFVRRMMDFGPRCRNDPSVFFAHDAWVRQAHLLALPPGDYEAFRVSFWDLQTALAEQDFQYFPHYRDEPYVREHLERFFSPERWWVELQEVLPFLKRQYDAQTAIDLEQQYAIRSS